MRSTYDLFKSPAKILARQDLEGPPEQVPRPPSRWSAGYLDELVEWYSPYRFALVFENKDWPGYVTEKIVSAFLAGAIPIYWGNKAVLDMSPGERARSRLIASGANRQL